MPGIVRPPRRPEGWTAPGPKPRGDQGRPELQPAADEDLCFLSGDFRLFQKRQGHRWSLDDLLCAELAARHGEALSATRLLDLGCGLGSVLLMLAWRFPTARVTGIEAQLDRAALGRRSLAWNGVDDRCEILTGDFRDAAVLPAGARFELITGTPPYFPLGTGTESDKAHAVPCRFEVRGGVEEYLDAAARWLAPGGRFVSCTAALEAERVTAGAALAGLTLIEHVEVFPKEGKPALLGLDVFTTGQPDGPARRATLVVRDAHDQWTPQFAALREAMGMPSRPPR